MKRISFIVASFILLVSLAACGKSERADIYTSVYPIQFLVENVVGGEYKVSSMYAKGQEIHGFEPTARLIEYMSNSKAIFYIGSGLETFIEINKTSIFKDNKLVCLSEDLNLVETKHICGHDELEDDAHHDPDHPFLYDPHVWLDPSRMLLMLDRIVEELVVLFPAKAHIFETNASKLSVDLADLHRDFQNAVENTAPETRYILVDHDAYVYWEDTYAIKRIRLRSDNDSCEVPSAQMDAKIIQAKDLGLKHVIVTRNEAECSNVSIYLKAIEGERVYMHNLGTVTEAELASGANYMSLMRQNLDLLIEILPNTNP